MRHFALSAVGRDRPGIVAAVSQVLLDHRCNVEDSQMAILRGHFTMTLIISGPATVDAEGLRSGLDAVRDELDLEAVLLGEVTELDPAQEPVPSHIVSVYGVDHPGIVHAVSAALAERGVTITDLTTRLIEEEGGEPIYWMMLEVALSGGLEPAALEAALQAVGRSQQVELSFRELEQDAL